MPDQPVMGHPANRSPRNRCPGGLCPGNFHLVRGVVIIVTPPLSVTVPVSFCRFETARKALPARLPLAGSYQLGDNQVVVSGA
jgi:hypothetical protein